MTIGIIFETALPMVSANTNGKIVISVETKSGRDVEKSERSYDNTVANFENRKSVESGEGGVLREENFTSNIQVPVSFNTTSIVIIIILISLATFCVCTCQYLTG